jgi:hypothetical protein
MDRKRILQQKMQLEKIRQCHNMSSCSMFTRDLNIRTKQIA